MNRAPGTSAQKDLPEAPVEAAPADGAADGKDSPANPSSQPATPVKFSESADLFWGRKAGGRRRTALKYRRFDTLGEALQFAAETLAGEYEMWIDIEGGRLATEDIRTLYSSPSFAQFQSSLGDVEETR